MTIKISAIICTHNRAGYLEKAIRSLIDQTLPKEQYEIIVVDNASTDGTRETVSRFEVRGLRLEENPETSHLAPRTSDLKYIYEPTLGLSQARNTGWQNAEGEYIAYLDDDAVAAPDWLQRILEAFASITPQPGVVGGKVEPIWEAPRPAWLADSKLGQLTVLDWGPRPMLLNDDQWFVGANMAFPRKVLEEIGGFKTYLGRKGGNLLSMEEILARKEIEKKGYKCFYSPAIIVRHHILPSRLTKKWFLDRAYWNGVSSALVNMYCEPPSFMKRFLKGASTLSRIILSPKDIYCAIASGNDPETFARKCSVYARLGHVMALWGIVR